MAKRKIGNCSKKGQLGNNCLVPVRSVIRKKPPRRGQISETASDLSDFE